MYVSESGKGYPVYWESKSLNEPKAFPMTRLEDHQINYLIKLYNALGEDALCLFLICVDFGRADKRVFVWKNKDLLYIGKNRYDSAFWTAYPDLSNYNQALACIFYFDIYDNKLYGDLWPKNRWSGLPIRPVTIYKMN